MKRRDFAHAIPAASVEVTLDLIDGKWKGVILFHLQQGTASVLASCGRRMPGITQRMLTKQLRALEEDRLIDPQGLCRGAAAGRICTVGNRARACAR